MHATASDIRARLYNHSREPGCVCVGVGGRPIVPVSQGPRSEERSGEGTGGSRIPDLGRAMLAESSVAGCMELGAPPDGFEGPRWLRWLGTSSPLPGGPP